MTDADKKTLEYMRIGCAQGWKVSLRTIRDATALIDRLTAELERATLRWSSDRPTVPGWYRSRTTCETQAESVHYITKQFIKSAEGVSGHWFDDHQFAGPIAKPLEPT